MVSAQQYTVLFDSSSAPKYIDSKTASGFHDDDFQYVNENIQISNENTIPSRERNCYALDLTAFGGLLKCQPLQPHTMQQNLLTRG